MKGMLFMWNRKKSVYLSIAVCVIVSVILALLLVVGPMLFRWFMTQYRGFSAEDVKLIRLVKVFCFTFYPCAVFAGLILYSLLRLLFNIRSGNVFISNNVRFLFIVSWCCFGIAIITFIAGFFYMPFFFVTAAGGFTGMLLRVLKNVMQNAVELRAENELTI